MEEPHLEYEKIAWSNNQLICGIDEVGRGCVAGPIVVGAVVMPKGHKQIEGVRDSKKISQKKREKLFFEIIEQCEDFSLGLASSASIDKIGIVSSFHAAAKYAVDGLKIRPDKLIVDAMKLPIEIEQEVVIKGDAIVYSISCASIIAKVFRDQIVSALDNVYEGYNFTSHKGYGTKGHYEAIIKLGLTKEHRQTFLRNLEF